MEHFLLNGTESRINEVISICLPLKKVKVQKRQARRSTRLRTFTITFHHLPEEHPTSNLYMKMKGLTPTSPKIPPGSEKIAKLPDKQYSDLWKRF